MPVKTLFVTLVALFFMTLHGSAVAEGPPQSGFLGDYSRLQPSDEQWIDYSWTGDGFAPAVAAAQAVIILQPEMFLAPDSKYKGMKPDQLKIITDSMRQLVVEAFEGDYQIATSPGPNTVVVRMAFSNLYLKKKPRIKGIGWVPVAYVATTAKRKVLDDFTDNILLTELVWEGEILDSQTEEVLGQIIVELGSRSDKDEFTSWDELVQALSVGAARLHCRFDNASNPDAPGRNCFEITADDINLVD